MAIVETSAIATLAPANRRLSGSDSDPTWVLARPLTTTLSKF